MSPSPEESKRKVMVGAIELCLSRSAVKSVVEPGTMEIYFQTHPDEVWGQSEVRLKPVWDVLLGQPGLTPKEVAPPLMVLKSYEHVLGMFVSLPSEMGDVPASELERHRSALALSEGEFADAVRQLEQEAKDAAALTPATSPSVKQPAAPSRAEVARRVDAKDRTKQTLLAAVLGVVTVIAIGLGVMFAFRQTAVPLDVSDLSSLIALKDARRDDNALIAVLADGKWETLDAAKQKELGKALFAKASEKGIKAITVMDGQGKVRIQAMDLDGTPSVSVR